MDEEADKEYARLMKDIANELKEAREHKTLLEGLLGHPGWDILTTLINKQIESRTTDVMASPLGDGKSLAKQEWLKGEASGLRLAKLLPGITLEICELVISRSAEDGNGDPELSDPEPDGGRDFDPGRDDPGSRTGN